jgi:hypothetical protein
VVYRFPGLDDSAAQEWDSLPFPRSPYRPDAERNKRPKVARDVLGRVSPPHAPHAALDALDDVSRRMENLARALDCLGFFEDDDGPRAA